MNTWHFIAVEYFVVQWKSVTDGKTERRLSTDNVCFIHILFTCLTFLSPLSHPGSLLFPSTSVAHKKNLILYSADKSGDSTAIPQHLDSEMDINWPAVDIQVHSACQQKGRWADCGAWRGQMYKERNRILYINSPLLGTRITRYSSNSHEKCSPLWSHLGWVDLYQVLFVDDTFPPNQYPTIHTTYLQSLQCMKFPRDWEFTQKFTLRDFFSPVMSTCCWKLAKNL